MVRAAKVKVRSNISTLKMPVTLPACLQICHNSLRKHILCRPQWVNSLVKGSPVALVLHHPCHLYLSSSRHRLVLASLNGERLRTRSHYQLLLMHPRPYRRI